MRRNIEHRRMVGEHAAKRRRDQNVVACIRGRVAGILQQRYTLQQLRPDQAPAALAARDLGGRAVQQRQRRGLAFFEGEIAAQRARPEQREFLRDIAVDRIDVDQQRPPRGHHPRTVALAVRRQHRQRVVPTRTGVRNRDLDGFDEAVGLALVLATEPDRAAQIHRECRAGLVLAGIQARYVVAIDNVVTGHMGRHRGRGHDLRRIRPVDDEFAVAADVQAIESVDRRQSAAAQTRPADAAVDVLRQGRTLSRVGEGHLCRPRSAIDIDAVEYLLDGLCTYRDRRGDQRNCHE